MSEVKQPPNQCHGQQRRLAPADRVDDSPLPEGEERDKIVLNLFLAEHAILRSAVMLELLLSCVTQLVI